MKLASLRKKMACVLNKGADAAIANDLRESILPTLDSLDAALEIEATTEGESRMLEGMRGTEALLLDALATEGFERIEAIGEPFDPALHEAVQVVPGEGDQQVVQQVLRKGYVMRGRVIRPSLVIVGHA